MVFISSLIVDADGDEDTSQVVIGSLTTLTASGSSSTPTPAGIVAGADLELAVG
jgi:hypothetical protein